MMPSTLSIAAMPRPLIPPAAAAPTPAATPPSEADLRWQTVIDRAHAQDFFYAVTTTGIVCRPGCRSRLPRRENVRFFNSLADAQRAGFRPCQRCQPDRESATVPATNAAGRAARYLSDNLDRTVPLAELAQHAGISPAHLQRVFTRNFGVSPHRYAEVLRVQRLATALPSESVTDATYTSGFSTPSRMYEAAARSGLRPRTLLHGGEAMTIRYTTAPSPFGGRILAAATGRGICAISLADDEPALLSELHQRFPNATIEPTSDPALSTHLRAVLDAIQSGTSIADLPLDLRPTAFQVKVWDALRAIPRGETRTYAQVAASLGQPTATRAVARACATNPVALAVPCHRVVGSTGKLTGYRWGIDRKRRILEAEQQG